MRQNSYLRFGRYKQWPLFGAKICIDVCLKTLSVPKYKTVLQEPSLRKTVSFKEHIQSKDKYTSMRWHKIEAFNCVYYPSNILQPAKLLRPKGLVYLI